MSRVPTSTPNVIDIIRITISAMPMAALSKSSLNMEVTLSKPRAPGTRNQKARACETIAGSTPGRAGNRL